MKWSPPDLVQPVRGYRYTTDAFLLASFAAGIGASDWCDLGTGSGVIAYVLASRLPNSRGIAIERQRPLLCYAVHNLRHLNLTLIAGDLRQVPWHKTRLDLVVCNPPYYEVGAGHINRDPMMAEARHTFHGDVTDFAAAVAPALRPDAVFCFIYPFLLHRRPLERLTAAGWYLAKRMLVRSFAGREPKLVCLGLTRRKPARPRETDLALYRTHRVFTQDTHGFLNGSPLAPKPTTPEQ